MGEHKNEGGARVVAAFGGAWTFKTNLVAIRFMVFKNSSKNSALKKKYTFTIIESIYREQYKSFQVSCT